ncbi:MAG TPA: hypothetical protein VGP25_18545 [Gemmatimonadaceae bacterium]|jgi:hypothetical protein|nr:hypothetical protein [Gemmatimonadaceae bacterium]
MASVWTVLLALLLGAPARRLAAPIPTTLLIHVVDSASRRPLPNAEVASPSRRRLTDAEGNARFPWPEAGAISVRVRQIGFRYVDRTLHRGTSTSATVDTVTIVLAPATFALPQVVTQADVRCSEKLDSAAFALSTSSMELLRFGAEQYNSFRAAYPFNVTLNRRTVRSPAFRGPRTEERSESAESETYGDPYLPGHALLKTPTGYYAPILFVSALADSAFWARHCFAAKGVESRDGRRVIRLDFSPARGVREVEWAGSAWLDSAASVLRRVDFRLVNVRDPRAPRRFEGYTTFSMPSPYIAVPDSTVAWWWSLTYPTESDDKFTADVLQFISTSQVKYRRELPPAPQLR